MNRPILTLTELSFCRLCRFPQTVSISDDHVTSGPDQRTQTHSCQHPNTNSNKRICLLSGHRSQSAQSCATEAPPINLYLALVG